MRTTFYPNDCFRPTGRDAKRALAFARPAFTLIEAAVATLVVGLGVAAILVAVTSGTRANHAGKKLTEAVFFAQELREATLNLPFTDPETAHKDNPPGADAGDATEFADDLDDLMDVTFCPPRDGQGQPIDCMPDWSQHVLLTWRNPANLSSQVADGASDLIYVEVTIAFQGVETLKTGWLVGRRN